MWDTIRFLRQHPLTRDQVGAALWRIARYQWQTRTRDETIVPWIGPTKLAVRRHMKGASGNIYAGLHEFADMGFLIHLLRGGDAFIDVGANVGSWTVLASALCGAKTLAIEADPQTAALLRRNIAVNNAAAKVTIAQVAVSDHTGTITFTKGLDTTNRLARAEDTEIQEVACQRLDDIAPADPVMIKIDVEGAEESVVRGAAETLRRPTLLAAVIESYAGPVEEMLAAAGFERVWYDPLTRILSREPNDSLANNALFVRDFAACQERVAAAPHRRLLGRQF